jgi:hypothetical protein
MVIKVMDMHFPLRNEHVWACYQERDAKLELDNKVQSYHHTEILYFFEAMFSWCPILQHMLQWTKYKYSIKG